MSDDLLTRPSSAEDDWDVSDEAGPTDWVSRLEPGDRFGAYRIFRVLGRGGMGEVYEAEHVEHRRRVALKVLHQRLQRPDQRARFLAEGRLAAAVNHPNSVYIFETDEVAGIPVIAMELLPGGTLRDRVRRDGPLPAAQAVDAMLQVVHGLDAAFGAGVLHRDVKPSNCFVDADGTIKIGDFGLSVSASSLDGLDTRVSFAGTPEFASPEQIVGARLDVRADIYSVGATLHFLVAGEPPFYAEDLDGLLRTIRTEPVRLPPNVARALHPGLAAVLRRCLAKSPSDRPGSYAELERELARFASTATTPAPVGLRVAAAAFDVVIMAPVVAIVLGQLVGSRLIRDPASAVILIAVALALYWGLAEGLVGAGYGKRRCGLTVVTLDGRVPGLSRALARSVVLVTPLALAAVADALLGPALLPPSALAAIRLAVLGAGLGTLLITMRRDNNFAGLHDMLTCTRVVRRSPVPQAKPAASTNRTPNGATGERVGPYEIVSIVGATDIGQIRLAWDPQLMRSIWIHTVPTDMPAVSVAIRNASRVGRLHWLNGHRAGDDAWDAYEALDGQPLLALTRLQPWSAVSIWLGDLARDLKATAAEDGRDDVLTLDRVWITADDRGKLLGFRAPGLSGPHEAKSFQPTAAQQFLHAAARQALGTPRPPLPLSVSECLRKLDKGEFHSLADVTAALSGLRAIPDRISPTKRGMALALAVVVYQFTSTVPGGVLLLLTSLVPVGTQSLTPPAAGLIGCAALSLIWAFMFRSGFWLRAFGIAVVTADGAEASRLRAVGRAALAWSWVPLQILGTMYRGPLVVISLLKMAGVLYAAIRPERGLHDRIAGTYLVPK